MNSFAHLKEDSPFFRLFQNGMVPITNVIVPDHAECIGDGVQPVYMVDLDRLATDQFERLLDLIFRLNGYTGSREVARKEIKAAGLPLRAKHVSGVSTDSRYFL